MSVGVKAAWISASAVVIAGIIGAIAILWKQSPTVSQSSTNSPGSIQAGRDVVSPVTQNAGSNNVGGVQIANSTNVNVGGVYIHQAIGQPDFIEGTQVTLKGLKQALPFGFIVFRLRDEKWTYEPYPDEHLKITADWSKVNIMPNFSEKTVRWTIPNVNHIFPGRSNLAASDNEIDITIPMDIEAMYAAGSIFAIQNQPAMLLGTLSDDQLHPVFVLGFRILEKPKSNVTK